MTRQIQVRVPTELVEQLDKLAATESTSFRQLSRSDVIRALVLEALRSRAVKVAAP